MAGWAVVGKVGAPGLVADRLAPPSRSSLRTQQLVRPAIAVAGVGGAGVRLLERPMSFETTGIARSIAIDVDATALARSRAHVKVCLAGHASSCSPDDDAGPIASNCYGLADPDRSALVGALTGCDVVLILAGLGGNTGTPLAPRVATRARELDAWTIAAVTTPFGFEGGRDRIALAGVTELESAVDSLRVFPNDDVLQILPDEASLPDAYRASDRRVVKAVTSWVGELHDSVQSG